MLLLLFHTREGRYALATDLIVEIVPLIKMKKIPKAPDYVAGLINYRGNPVPVIDLCSLTEGNPCTPLFSTRIIIINYPFDNNTSKTLGLIAERATETIKAKVSDIHPSKIFLDDDISSFDESNQEEIIQRFDLKRIIPQRIVSELYQD
ncbi:MAG: chemotaxis protein CheW [Proteobacteria bacterium]|nr:chemotaxis protein CheW [Pseudomonadota bacterium]MBU1708795.1 chemotaxis protein CheW [Pseudomonadota bacterium]